MSFADALNIELGNESHVGLLKCRSSAEGMFALNFADGNLVMNATVRHSGRASIWGSTFSDQDMTNHMEEDVGIFDPDGLVAYAAYFRDALVAGVGMDLTTNGDAVERLFLVLQFRIGTSRLEGRIELSLSQSNLPSDVFTMVKLAYHFDPTRKIATGTRNTLTIRNTAKLLEATDDAEDGPGAADAPSAAAAAESAEASSAAAAAARAAKKRRVGGVNIFPGMRKK